MSLLSAGMAMAGGGGVIGAFGNLMSGFGAAAAAKQQAKIADLQSAAELRRGEEEKRLALIQEKKITGTQTAAYARAGVVESGTPMLVMADTITNSRKDIINAETESILRAYGYRIQAALLRKQASQAQLGGIFGAAGSLLTGTGSAVTMRL